MTPLDRRQFLTLAGMLGLGAVGSSVLAACSDAEPTGFDGKVLIIGAGPAGMAAGHLLAQRGVDFEILEALSTYGGRIKHKTDFVDYPISLGGEWIHVDTSVLDEIVNDSSVEIATRTSMYDQDRDVAFYEGFEITMEDVGFTIDSKFIGSSWLGFFEEYVLASVSSRITYETIVESVDYSGDAVTVGTSDGSVFEADRVIVTVPVKMLQNGAIDFSPALPDDKRDAIAEVKVWEGCKAFIEFEEKFFATAVAFEEPDGGGQKLYYDAGYGQDSSRHALGLFAVGNDTVPYVDLPDDELIAYMLDELDDLFDGQATPNYIQHVFQNWNAEPFANGAYVHDSENWRRVRELGKPVGDNLFFAGDAYTEGEDWSSVHTAVRSARRAVDTITG